MKYWYEDDKGITHELTQEELDVNGGKDKFFGGSPLVVTWGEIKCEHPYIRRGVCQDCGF